MQADNDYHLQSAAGNNAQSYTYDPVGSRLTLSPTIPSLSGANTYSYDADDRLSTDTYDSDGNTKASSGITNTYDFENHLPKHLTTVTMTYDGDGIRVSKTAGGVTTKYLVDTLNPTGYSQVMDEVFSGAVTKTYTYGNAADQRESGLRQHLDADFLRLRRPRQRALHHQHRRHGGQHLPVRRLRHADRQLGHDREYVSVQRREV